MTCKNSFLPLPAVLAGGIMMLAPGNSAAESVNFSREVLPVLSDRCFYCHGPDEKHRKADLRLDVEAAAKAPGKNGTAIVPGKPADSLLVERIFTMDPDEQMPPPEAHKDLSAAQKETLQRWIAEGAPWGRHWAFSPLEPPAVFGKEVNPVDALVVKKLAQEGLEPAPEADPVTLLRRLTLHLTGLPATAEEMSGWLSDPSPQGWEKQVDRLLASPAYGERMAWDWMEAARYADTNGYQGDNTRTMWPWRDWVVRAFNSNMPWDQFTVWQLAGDLLPQATDEQRLATGFLRNHPINGEGGRIPAENRVDYVMDMSETTGTVWLGLTMNCCRCHDHKFDPIKQSDYYSLFAFFNQTPVDGSGGDPATPPVLSVPDPASKAKLAGVEAALTANQVALETGRMASAARQAEWESKLIVDALKEPEWITLKPESAKAAGSKLEIMANHALLNSGPAPANDDFEIVAKPGAGRWTGVRLDALRHASMKHESLSRSESGNFVLTKFEVKRQKSNGTQENVAVSAVEASFEQGQLKLAGVLDEDKSTGWGVWDGRVVDRNHAAVLRFIEPLETTADTVLTLHMRHESPNKQHVMGHFRLSLTQADAPRLTKADGAILAALQTPQADRSDAQKAVLTAAWEEADERIASLRRGIIALKTQHREITGSAPKVMIMADRAEVRETYILDHGLYNKPLSLVSAATPGSLPAMPPDFPRNRLSLAKWIVSPDNPLTARVTVNRWWQMLFGIGLVKTAEDFGVQAEFPPQAALLDWLAADFRDSGWDVKRLLRTILTSKTWRQSSRITPAQFQRDPANRLLARGARFRMPSWMIRDQALAASGLLQPMAGGAPVNPWQPDGVWEEATFGNVKYQRDRGDDLHRRSLYTFWRRIVGPTMFFDAGSRLVCNVKPLRTNTPLHALSTTNDTTIIESARALALSCAGLPDPAAKLNNMFQRVLGRPVRPGESAVLLAGMERHLQKFSATPDKARVFLSAGETVPLPEALTPVLAAWTMTALTILNMDETLTLE